ncbi:tyrosine-protein phosphatase [Flavobacterium sp. 14A]|uniref:tyrosine-protein phosphatase n=1 Tax=Flavobacterium sp. 14A TaxID=2735896 RepID=UPI00156DB888|nr:CpsB/CapC family capsule biosynthesis tyrosine phosphatase [Flavobacterium sp. 14A]NRT13288.1 tyrosine-protein phosphatase YwqE [Flavobacterium sp. 14A]
MFFFSRNKPVLKDLIPEGHIDIHAHLLPGIDDGAATFADSLQLIQAMQGFGITQFIATPHIIQGIWDNTHEQIISKKEETLQLLANSKASVPLHAAAEYLMDDQFARLFQKKELLTLKGKHVLVEMSYINAPIQLYNILYDLQLAGYVPVLAHPERYLFYHNDFNEYAKLVKAGCLLQLNLLSVVGYYGGEIAKIAEKLLSKGMYSYVGSDVHHLRHIAAFDQKVLLKDLQPLHEIIVNNQFFKRDTIE